MELELDVFLELERPQILGFKGHVPCLSCRNLFWYCYDQSAWREESLIRVLKYKLLIRLLCSIFLKPLLYEIKINVTSTL
jgi:hypothetical protein